MALEAILAAVDDAGLLPTDLDGIATFHLNDSAPVDEVANALGLADVTWFQEEYGGGSRAPVMLGQAALAVATNCARHVVLYRALNGRSGLRMGGASGRRSVRRNESQYQRPYGIVAPSHQYAMAARMHMERYGTTPEQLGAVAVQQRANAVLNDRALMRTPITLTDYLASRPIVEPLRLLDCCLESDGACAVVVTSRQRGAHLRPPPVTILGWAATLGPNDFQRGGDLTVSSVPLIAQDLFSMAGLGPHDVDVAELYDAFSVSALVQLEDFGFCPKGEGGPFLESGAAGSGGTIPVNTHGGFLSEGYIHGLNHICEAVEQLRGQAGARQVTDAEVALSTGQPGWISGMTSAVVLGRG